MSDLQRHVFNVSERQVILIRELFCKQFEESTTTCMLGTEKNGMFEVLLLLEVCTFALPAL